MGHSHDALLGLIEGRELRQNGVVGVGHLDDDEVFLMYGTALWQGMVSELDDWRLCNACLVSSESRFVYG